MRNIKIRGHKRRQKSIARWRHAEMSVDLVRDVLNKRDREHVEILVHPWCDLLMVNSAIPEPHGKTRRQMLNALLDIYEHWEMQLDKTGQPYDLKIWLYKQRFSRSQVVCAIGDALHFYDHTFSLADEQEPLQTRAYGKIAGRLEDFNWAHGLDEAVYADNEVGEPDDYASTKDFEETRIWFTRLLKKKHKIIVPEPPLEGITELYSFKRGDVYIGSKKNISFRIPIG